MGKNELKDNEVNIVLFEQDGIPTVRAFSDLGDAGEFSNKYNDIISKKEGFGKSFIFTETLDRGVGELNNGKIPELITKCDISIEPKQEDKILYVVIFNEDEDIEKEFEFSSNTEALVFDNEKIADLCARNYSSIKFKGILNRTFLEKHEIKDNKVHVGLYHDNNQELGIKIFTDHDDIRSWLYLENIDYALEKIHGFLDQEIHSGFQLKYENKNPDIMEYPRFLGIGSCFNTSLGNTSCYFHISNKLILIDCGYDVFPKIKKIIDQNKNIKEVIVLITHLHSDHVGSLSSLIEYCYMKKININLIYPETDMLEKCLEYHLVEKTLYGWICKDRDSKSYYINILSTAIDIVPIKLIHRIYNNISSYGYILCYGNKYFIFAWDTCDIHPTVYEEFNLIINMKKTLYEITNNVDREVFLFHDTCIAEYPGNVHTHYSKLINIFKENRDKIFFVHMDDKDKLDKIARENGFGNIDQFYKEDK